MVRRGASRVLGIDLGIRESRPLGEEGPARSVSYGELYRKVAGLAARLREWGIRPGDRVAGFLPNIPESVVAMLAAASVGAAWSSCSPDFGIRGVLDRFGQIAPRVLFTADGYFQTIDLDQQDRPEVVAAGDRLQIA